MTSWLIVFATVFILDVVWAQWSRAVGANQAAQASLWAVGITLASAFLNIGYVKNPWLVIPACLGAFAGTYASIKWRPA